MVVQGERCFLIVDDDESNHDKLKPSFEAKGIKVFSAFGGEEALQILERERIDLVLLDLMMPGLDGQEVLTIIRKSWNRAELPVLILTGMTDTQAMIDALKTGANDYLMKPLNFDVVMARVEAQLHVISLSVAPPRTSGFHRLRRRPDPKLPTCDAHCGQCFTALRAQTEHCTECQAQVPEEGWPPIEGSDHPWLGQILARRYHIERFIGRGSASMVYRVRDLDLKTSYAAKIITLQDPRRPEGLQRGRLLREIETLARLTNPHVVHIHEVIGIDDDHAALITDYVQGMSLQEVLDRLDTLDPPAALDILRQIAQGLHEAHNLGLVHRDIKPANIMLEDLPAGGYFARLLDFGIVTTEGLDEETATTPGTPHYMAPEQITSKAMDARTDIYALGCVLFKTLTGRTPFKANQLRAILRQHLRAPTPKISEVDPALGVIPGLEEMTRRMMARKPEARFQSLSEVIEAIETLRFELNMGSRPEIPARPKPPRAKTGPTGILASALSARHKAVVIESKANGECSLREFDFTLARSRKRTLNPKAPLRLAALSRDGRFVALSGPRTSDIWWLNLDSKDPPKLLEPSSQPVTTLAITSESGIIIYGDAKGQVFTLTPEGEEVLLSQSESPVTGLAFLPKDNAIAIGRADETLQVQPVNASVKERPPKPMGFVATQISLVSANPMEGVIVTASGSLMVYQPDVAPRIIKPSRLPMALCHDRKGRLVGLDKTRAGELRLVDLDPLLPNKKPTLPKR